MTKSKQTSQDADLAAVADHGDETEGFEMSAPDIEDAAPKRAKHIMNNSD